MWKDRFSALPGAITEARTVSRAAPGCEAVGDGARPAEKGDSYGSACIVTRFDPPRHPQSEREARRCYWTERQDIAHLTAGRLTPEDIMRCHLSPRGGALGVPLGGAGAGEGVVGLARALLGVGVQTVVVALWALPDEQTSSLMSHFYDRLTASERVDVGDAMREAMLRTRADVVAGGQAIAGVTEGHWSGLMVLGCGTVSLRVASSSCTTVVPEGVPPEWSQNWR